MHSLVKRRMRLVLICSIYNARCGKKSVPERYNFPHGRTILVSGIPKLPKDDNFLGREARMIDTGLGEVLLIASVNIHFFLSLPATRGSHLQLSKNSFNCGKSY